MWRISRRDRLALLTALGTTVAACTAFFFSAGTNFLMPGPLASAHAAIENCASCHSKNGSGKLSWVHGLVVGNPISDSKACLACHKMPATAFFPHGASAGVLLASTKRLTTIAATTLEPVQARFQNRTFPSHDVVSRGLYCATCHQEHRGADFNLSKITNEQCRSCHVVKFDSFDGNHPKFDSYPFDRRTPIIYDHAAHFEKHFPETAKKDQTEIIPASCSTCHDDQSDKRIMSVAPFDKTCSGCHLKQITGQERATGPKGIAFLTLPGLDLQTLRKKNTAIGEWPDASDAELTPFMKIMISRSEKGRALLRNIDRLNLQDLSNASDDQITAVKNLVWEIKQLFYALVSAKASDVLGNLNISNGAKLSASLVGDLTASIPRDVVSAAQQQWLPNLAREIAAGPDSASLQPAAREIEPRNSDPESAAEPSAPTPESREKSEPKKEVSENKYDPPACAMRILGTCIMPTASDNPDETQSDDKSDSGKKSSSQSKLPEPMRAGVKDAVPEGEPHGRESPANQSDELLFPTDKERREMKSVRRPEANAPTSSEAASRASPQTTDANAPAVISIEANVDPESWAEYGGWYRQDYGIFYRPAGHKDKFIYSWIFLTGPQAPKGNRGPAADVFDVLTNKDAQGSCTKCHSVDDIQGKGRVVNFSPPSPKTRAGSFTTFIHEPHFGVVGKQGCLTCHNLEKNRPYLKSYEQGNPHIFASSFGTIDKDLCKGCHAAGKVRQDCLTCHKYHVNGVVTPIINTKIPMQ